MDSLHESVVVNSFAGACVRLWVKWLSVPVPKKISRRETFVNAHRDLCTSIVLAPIEIVFDPAITDCGSFTWPSWKIEMSGEEFGKDDLVCEDFVEMCKTIYHETRHAEQFYRMAQGLALGRLNYPGGRYPDGHAFTKAEIETSLDIHGSAAQHAVNNKNNYELFAMTQKLPHCSSGSGPGWSKWDATVDDWLQRTYAEGKKRFAEWGQASGKRLETGVRVVSGSSRRVIDKAFYLGAEDETDAVAMEALIEKALTRKITKYAAYKNKPRTDAVFGT